MANCVCDAYICVVTKSRIETVVYKIMSEYPEERIISYSLSNKYAAIKTVISCQLSLSN